MGRLVFFFIKAVIMSFWTTFISKTPAILSGVSGLSAIASVLFPAQTAIFQAASAFSGVLGGILHSLPNTINSTTIATDIVPTIAPVVAAVATDTKIVTPDQAAQATALAEQIASLVNTYKNQK